MIRLFEFFSHPKWLSKIEDGEPVDGPAVPEEVGEPDDPVETPPSYLRHNLPLRVVV